MRIYKKGVKLILVNKQTNEQVKYTTPRDNMCKLLITRDLIMAHGYPENQGWLVIEQ